MEDTDYWTI